MNTHDIDIELPPLPEPECIQLVDGVPAISMAEHMEIARQYAHTAIEADRKRRGEPVAWKWRHTPVTKWECVGHWDSVEAKAAAEMESHGWEVVRLYDSPQAAEPVKRKR
jgi:hypothetical protein